MKEVHIRDEFIKLGQALKLCGEASLGSDAKMLIENGSVLVNGETELRRGRKLYKGDVFKINNEEYVIS